MPRNQTTFTKGHGGPGRPRLTPESLAFRDELRKLAPRAMERIIEVIKSEHSTDRDKLKGCLYILDRGFGRLR